MAAVDCLDRLHSVTRKRGEPAEPPVLDSAGRGDISTSLRILTDMTYSRSPRPSSFNAHYPTLAAEATRTIVHGDGLAIVHAIIEDRP